MHMSRATETPEYPCEPCHSAALQCARIPKQVCTEPHASHHLLLLFSLLLSLLYPFFIRRRALTHMYPFSADALSICQLIMLWQQ